MSMLRSIREKKGLTLGQLAARAGISAKTLTDYEEGRQPISLAHAKVIAKALWVQIEDLMPPAGSAPPAPRPTPAPSMQGPAYTGQPAPTVQGESYGASTPQAAYAGTDQQAAPPALRSQPTSPPRPSAEGIGGGRDLSAHGMPLRQLDAAPRRGPDTRMRPSRPVAPPPKPISEGQTEELMRLAARLELDQEALETRTGKPVSAMVRSEAKDWIKKLRDTANESSPGGRVHYGQWPGTREDEEAAYLAHRRDAGTVLLFKLFNGEQFTGAISEFTPYTITITMQPGDEQMVLRKLAIVYYRQTGEANRPPEAAPQATEANVTPVPHSHPPEETGVSSDRVGEPAQPEIDRMDTDRGV